MAAYLGSNKIDSEVNQTIIYDYATQTQIIDRTISNYQSTLSIIGNYAFYGCSLLTSVNFPNCISIGSNAFLNCNLLTEVIFPNCNTIDFAAFKSCSALTVANFPNCTSIGSSAFQYCNSLITISFPNCSYMGLNTFWNIDTLTIADFPNCNQLDGYNFAYCNNLTTANFPNCSYIGTYAFNSCSSLINTNFLNCGYIGNSAFGNCSLLTAVNFPSCSCIGSYAFYRCWFLISLYLIGVSSVPTLSSYVFNSTPIGGYTNYTYGVYGSVYVPSSLYNSFLTATNWSDISARIVGADWNFIFSETATVENQGIAWDTEGWGATLLVAGWEYYGSNLNTIETAKITLNNVTYICSNYITENDESFFGAFETTNGPMIDFADFQIYPFMLYYSPDNEYMALRLDPNKFSEDDEIIISFEGLINYLP